MIVDASIEAAVGFDCSRCLAPQTLAMQSRKSYVLVKRTAQGEGVKAITVSDDEDDDAVDSFEGDEIDLQDMFRQELMLTLPMNPVCENAGVEPCAELATPEKTDPEEEIDPRWAPLLELKKNLK